MYPLLWDSLVAQIVKSLPAMQETWVQSLGWEDPLEKKMATHSSILAWEIPWMEEPGWLQSMGSQRVRHDWTTSLLDDLCTPYFEKQWSIGYLLSQMLWDLFYDCIMHFDKCLFMLENNVYPMIIGCRFPYVSFHPRFSQCCSKLLYIFWFCLPQLSFIERCVLKLPNLVMISQFLIIVLSVF